MPDYPKAAVKNLSDAKILLDHERWDGAAYHAGFVGCVKSLGVEFEVDGCVMPLSGVG